MFVLIDPGEDVQMRRNARALKSYLSTHFFEHLDRI